VTQADTMGSFRSQFSSSARCVRPWLPQFGLPAPRRARPGPFFIFKSVFILIGNALGPRHGPRQPPGQSEHGSVQLLASRSRPQVQGVAATLPRLAAAFYQRAARATQPRHSKPFARNAGERHHSRAIIPGKNAFTPGSSVSSLRLQRVSAGRRRPHPDSGWEPECRGDTSSCKLPRLPTLLNKQRQGSPLVGEHRVLSPPLRRNCVTVRVP
jgi:hypothetical protein